ncbi:MAG: hypothetical protein J7559_04925 [Cohnella sp.]|nr:hypothetical protein [Cohnella sp.]
MNQLRVIQLLGLFCLFAGIARFGMTPTSLIWGTDSWQELTCGYIASITMAIGTIALYMVQSKESGVLGFISTIGIILGNICTTAMLFVSFIIDTSANEPEGVAVAITGIGAMVGLMGGTLLFAIATYRAKVFPRWVAGLSVLMLLVGFLPIEDNKYMAAFWGIAYVVMGYYIWAGKLSSPRQQEQIEAKA